MKIKYFILSLLIGVFTIGLQFLDPAPALAVYKDEQIYIAFQEILDRDPEMTEYHFYIKGFESREFVKTSLNKTDERREVIKNIYQRALKRNPREDELQALVRFVAPNNLIRKQLYESKERKLAIIDAYHKFLDREPSPSDLAFYVETRSPFEKIKEVLNSSDERKVVLVKKYTQINGTEPNPNELAYMIKNQLIVEDVQQVQVLGIQYVAPVIKEGPVSIVIFNDFECIHCVAYHKTIDKMKNYFLDQIELTIKHFPLPFHKESLKAAMAYECAKEQGRGDEMSSLIHQARIDEIMSEEQWKQEAVNLELDTEQFNECLDNDKYADKIQADIIEGKSLGVSGTPTTFIEDEKILGNVSFDEIARRVRKYIK